MNILLVEDNPGVRTSIRRWIAERLPRVGTIVECSDGGQAVELYKSVKPDWVLMDIKLGKTDGLTATKRIISSFPDAQIIILTNHDDDAFREEAQRVGARWYILKEDLEEIVRIVEPAL